MVPLDGELLPDASKGEVSEGEDSTAILRVVLPSRPDAECRKDSIPTRIYGGKARI